MGFELTRVLTRSTLKEALPAELKSVALATAASPDPIKAAPIKGDSKDFVVPLPPIQSTQIASKPVGTPVTSQSERTTDLPSFLERRFRRNNATFGKSSISEEEAYAGIVSHSLMEQFGREVSSQFESSLTANYQITAKQPGITGFERATNQALRELVSLSTIDEQAAQSIKTTAFNLAQFDGDLDQLYDGYSSSDLDSTTATKTNSQALASIFRNYMKQTSTNASDDSEQSTLAKG